MKVNCDKCKKDFNMKPKQKRYKGGIEELYFKCPHCKERYSSFFTNPKIRKKQLEIRNKSKIMKSTRNNVILSKIEKDINDLQAELKIEIPKLRETMIKRLNL